MTLEDFDLGLKGAAFATEWEHKWYLTHAYQLGNLQMNRPCYVLCDVQANIMEHSNIENIRTISI